MDPMGHNPLYSLYMCTSVTFWKSFRMAGCLQNRELIESMVKPIEHIRSNVLHDIVVQQVGGEVH